MVMLHGGGVCYRGALPVAEEMAKIYHVVLVAYDGFNPDEPETEFKSVPDEARRLGDYIVEYYGGKIVCKMMDRSEESFDRIVYHDATWQSWVNQDKCMIGRHRNFDLFKRTDMYIWHGIASSTEKKLAKHVKAWQDKGYAFTYKVFPNMGHGTLAGEHPQEFSKEVQAAHRCSLQKEKV